MQNSNFMLIMVVFLAIFMLFSFRQNKKRVDSAKEAQKKLIPGTPVKLTSGLYGTVTSITDEDIYLEISPGVITKWDKRALLKVVSDENDEKSASENHGSLIPPLTKQHNLDPDKLVDNEPSHLATEVDPEITLGLQEPTIEQENPND